jgi:hypothetical protein
METDMTMRIPKIYERSFFIATVTLNHVPSHIRMQIQPQYYQIGRFVGNERV